MGFGAEAPSPLSFQGLGLQSLPFFRKKNNQKLHENINIYPPL